jgi:hypothetical protein
MTANPNDLKADDWRVNGAGRAVSHVFGYGMVDAGAVVEMAETWVGVPNQRVCRTDSMPNPSRQNCSIPALINIPTEGCVHAPASTVKYLEHVSVHIVLYTEIRGSVEIYLTSPMGKPSCGCSLAQR